MKVKRPALRWIYQGLHCNPGKLTIINTQEGDIIRVYSDANRGNLLLQETSAGSEIQMTIPAVDVGETVFITNQATNRNESKALEYTIGSISDLESITADENYTSRTFGLQVDFSAVREAMVGIVKLSGDSSIGIEIYDETGKKVSSIATWETGQSTNATYKRWVTLKKPENGNNVQTYNVKVKVTYGKY